MKVLVVGATGFLAKNLIAALENIISGKDMSYDVPGCISLYKYSRSMGRERLAEYCRDCDFVFYLAGVNRPEDPKEYMEGNAEFLGYMLKELSRQNKACPVMYASSVQAVSDNAYGESKRAGEHLLERYGQETGSAVYIYRLTNIFGKWCRPDYNSVIATFCYHIAREQPITIDDEEKKLYLHYIDDVVEECIGLLKRERAVKIDNPLCISSTYCVTLKEITDLIYSFRRSREMKQIPDMREGSFSQRLYSTYLTYLPEDQFRYTAEMNHDQRGSFTELIRTEERGQISVNIIKPGVTKGEHWHHTKNEKFIVVNGKGLIRLRQIFSREILDFHVTGAKIEVVDIPPGYTHNITNEGDTDLVAVMWANEKFQKDRPDTYFLKVEEDEGEEWKN